MIVAVRIPKLAGEGVSAGRAGRGDRVGEGGISLEDEADLVVVKWPDLRLVEAAGADV